MYRLMNSCLYVHMHMHAGMHTTNEKKPKDAAKNEKPYHGSWQRCGTNPFTLECSFIHSRCYNLRTNKPCCFHISHSWLCNFKTHMHYRFHIYMKLIACINGLMYQRRCTGETNSSFWNQQLYMTWNCISEHLSEIPLLINKQQRGKPSMFLYLYLESSSVFLVKFNIHIHM